jgi:hypothetical protein
LHQAAFQGGHGLYAGHDYASQPGRGNDGAAEDPHQRSRDSGAGHDPLLFDFANDVDNTQQAEIDIMRHILKERE